MEEISTRSCQVFLRLLRSFLLPPHSASSRPIPGRHGGSDAARRAEEERSDACPQRRELQPEPLSLRPSRFQIPHPMCGGHAIGEPEEALRQGWCGRCKLHSPLPCRQTTSFIASAMSSGAVYVHCYAGVSRGPSVVIAFLMMNMGMTFKDAYSVCKRARPQVD
eukprot:764690-Hanusia_phi.AAC.6